MEIGSGTETWKRGERKGMFMHGLKFCKAAQPLPLDRF